MTERTTITYDQILDLNLDNPAFPENFTIRDYLRQLLTTLWVEKEGFSGKRPFGNSDWEYDLYFPLIQAGVIHGSVDEDGCIQEVDDFRGNVIITSLIDYVFSVAYGE